MSMRRSSGCSAVRRKSKCSANQGVAAPKPYTRQTLSGPCSDDGLSRTCRYGPFWIATTLVFVSAVTGNYASYLSYRHKHAGAGAAQQVWYYDINKVPAVIARLAMDAWKSAEHPKVGQSLQAGERTIATSDCIDAHCCVRAAALACACWRAVVPPCCRCPTLPCCTTGTSA